MTDPITLGATVLPSLIGLIGGGKGGSKRQEVKPETMPSVPPELQASLEALAKLFEGVINPDALTTKLGPIEEMDFGPTGLGTRGEAALDKLSEQGGGKLIYDTTPEESSAASWLERMQSGEMGDAMRGKLTELEAAAQSIADTNMAKQANAIRGKYANMGQLSSSAPIAETVGANKEIAQSLAQGKAERGLGLEQYLTNIGLQAAPMLANIGQGRGQRAVQAGQLGLSGLGTLLDSEALRAQLQGAEAQSRYGEALRREELPYSRLSQLASILGSFRTGENYYPQSEPSEFAQAFDAGADAWPSIWEMISGYFGRKKNTGTGAGNTGGIYNPYGDEVYSGG